MTIYENETLEDDSSNSAGTIIFRRMPRIENAKQNRPGTKNVLDGYEN
jgi:hypothetical protein